MCKRMKRKDQNSEGRLATTCACIGTEEVRRYSNDTKEERNTESSNARHIPTTQGGTFKTPRETGEGRNSGEQLDTIARSPDSLVEDRSGGKTLSKEEKSRQKSKLWWKKRETMENEKKASMENLRKRVYIQESIHEVAYWKRRESIEKKPFEYTYSERKEHTEKEERKTLYPVNLATEQNNQVTWKGLTLTGKGAKHDQRNRKKRIETKDRLVLLETVKEDRREEIGDGETLTERHTRYKQEGKSGISSANSCPQQVAVGA